MIVLDSAWAPNAAQATQASDGGIGMWCVYVATLPGVHLYHPWSAAEIEVARIVHPHPIAFYSGADDPFAVKAACAALSLWPCLDLEDAIRGDGPWVQGNLDAVGGGLYGGGSVHPGRSARFHIGSYYPVQQPPGRPTWPSWWPLPSGPHGWQVWNTHNEFGVGVDLSYFDDALAALLGEKGDTLELSTAMYLVRDCYEKYTGAGPPSVGDQEAWAGAMLKDGADAVALRIASGQAAPGNAGNIFAQLADRKGQKGDPGPASSVVPVHSHDVTTTVGDPK